MPVGRLAYFFIRERCFEVSSGPRAVGAVRITPVATMKGSPDLIPAAGDVSASSVFQVIPLCCSTFNSDRVIISPLFDHVRDDSSICEEVKQENNEYKMIVVTV